MCSWRQRADRFTFCIFYVFFESCVNLDDRSEVCSLSGRRLVKDEEPGEVVCGVEKQSPRWGGLDGGAQGGGSSMSITLKRWKALLAEEHIEVPSADRALLRPESGNVSIKELETLVRARELLEERPAEAQEAGTTSRGTKSL